MKHLLVVAHPAEDSLTMTLARAYREELLARGQQCEWFDLYRAGFDPVLCADEIGPRTALRPVAADVARAQADVVAADAMAVIYPLWWLAMPAMMKRYVDRVLARGFADEVRVGVARGLMNGKGKRMRVHRPHHARCRRCAFAQAVGAKASTCRSTIPNAA